MRFPHSNKRAFLPVVCFFLASAAALALPAHAAPLDFTSTTQIVLTSPSTTLTIATGSVADSLTVDATSVAGVY